MVAHVRVPLALQLPWCYRHVQSYLHRHDHELRLRRSIDEPGYFVLERRVRKAPAINTAMRLRTDAHLQARDGYLLVSTVHASYLSHPWRMVEKLKTEGADLWEVRGGAVKLDQEERYEELWAKETRRRKRRQMLRELALEQHDILCRTGFPGSVARTRINNAGTTPTQTAA